MERVYRTDLKLLRYFLAVAEGLYFGRAAACLDMPQSLLSIHIKELKNQLDTQLPICHLHSVVLTHVGKISIEELCRLLVNVNNMLARVEQIGRGEAGRIEFGVVGAAMWGRMRPAMRRLLRENPNVEVLFREKMPTMQMVLLERRELDAGIWRMATEPPTGSTSLRLHESALLVVMPEEHYFSSFSTVPLEALRDEYFTTMLPMYTDQDFLQRVCQQVRLLPVAIREANESQTVLATVNMGTGITLIADSYAQMNWPDVIFRPLKERTPVDLYIVYETQQATPAPVKPLAALAQQMRGTGTAGYSWSDK